MRQHRFELRRQRSDNIPRNSHTPLSAANH
jgi:hypothetical protein